MKSFILRFSFYVNRMYAAALFIFFVSASAAQKKPDTSFRLLWYQGKRINDSTLLKTTGEKVSYSPSQHSVSVSYPAGQDPFTVSRTRISQNEASKIQMDKMVIGTISNPRPPGMVVVANQAFDQAVNDVVTVLENRFSFSQSGVQSLAQELAMRMNELPPQVRAYYDDVMNYVHHPDPGTAFALSPPPSYHFDYCFPCDEERKDAYKRDSAAFINSFLATENLNMAKASAVLEYLQKQKPKPGTDSIFSSQIRAEMFAAIQFITERIENKLINVWNTYKGDPAKVPFLVGLLIKMQHMHQLMGMQKVAGFPDVGILAIRLLVITLDVLNKAKDDRDYPVLLNVRGIMYLFKYSQLIGLEPEQFVNGMEAYLKLNRFQVIVDAEAKMGMDETSEMAKLHFEGPFDAFPEPKDSTCELKWYPHGMDSAKGILYKLEQVEVNTPQGPATYTGTREFGSKRPWLKLDFCKKDRDSALFFPFFPYHGMDTWTIGEMHDAPLQVVNTIFMTCFLDVEAMKKKGEELKKPGAMANLSRQMSSVYQQKVAPAMGGMNMDPSTMTAKDYERAAGLMDAADEMTHLTWATALYYFPLKGQLKNHQKIIFDEVLDGKKISPSPNVVFANFKVRIEHIED